MLLFATACNQQEPAANTAKTGQKSIFSVENEVEPDIRLMISASQVEMAKEIELYGCDFDVVVHDASDTIYLATSDPDFITSEKFRVGTKLGQIPLTIRKNVQTESGWGYYIPLKSGWNLAFCEGSACTDQKLTDHSEIKWIFKRK